MTQSLAVRSRNPASGFAALGAMGAALATGGMPAAAQDAGFSLPGGKITIGIEGGMAGSDFTREWWVDEDKYGQIDDDSGQYGALRIHGGLANGWDWSVSGSMLKFPENVSDTDAVSGDFSARHLDFDIGRTMQQGGSEFRMALGLSAAEIDQTMSKGLASDPEHSSFSGIGPRASASLSHRLGDSAARMRLIAGASIAVYCGDATRQKGLNGYSDDSELTHSAAYLGMAYDATQNMSFKIGLRVDAYKSTGDYLPAIRPSEITAKTAFVGMDVKF